MGRFRNGNGVAVEEAAARLPAAGRAQPAAGHRIQLRDGQAGAVHEVDEQGPVMVEGCVGLETQIQLRFATGKDDGGLVV